jgi:hypothetical protein
MTTATLMATQTADAVAITGGTIDGATIGATTPPTITMAAASRELFGGLAASANFGKMFGQGNIYRAIGNPFAANAADTTDDILGGIALDAAAFDAAGRGINITAQGKSGSTGNNKRMRLWINPTMSGQTVTNGVISGGTVTGAGSGVLLIDTGTTTINAKGWQLFGQLFKYGAAGSNTQFFQGNTVLDTTHGGILAPTFLTQTESAIMNLVITGASQTTGAANDVLLQLLEFNAMN